MGIIKSAITAGTTYAIANKGLKAYNEHEKTKSQTQQRVSPQPQFQQSPSGPYQPISSSRSADGSAYQHQPYCNGQCNEQCHGNAMQYQQPQEHLALPPPQEPSMPWERESSPSMGRGIETPPVYENVGPSGAGWEQAARLGGEVLKKQ